MTTSTSRQNYMPQLDTLRFFAVLGVMVTHNWHPRRLPGVLGDLDWAGLGVHLFFVLSGFLITRILLDCRNEAENTGVATSYFIRQFYIRRVLRIFPIYYLVVIIGLIINLPPAREIWGWLITYTTNIYITINDDWIGKFGHLWSLAVEEQFYLIWPWIVLFIPRKRLMPILLFLIALAPVYRLYAFMYFPFDIGAMDFKAATLLFGNLDSLAMGALLAYAWNSGLPKRTLQKYLTYGILPIGLVLYTLSLTLYHYRTRPVVFFVIADLFAAFIFVWLVSAASMGFKGIIGKILEFPPFLYLGKISYGLYVYHNFMSLILVPTLARFGYTLNVPGRVNFLLSTILTITIASASWYWIESPINRLKDRFRYLPGQSDIPPVPEQITGTLN